MLNQLIYIYIREPVWPSGKAFGWYSGKWYTNYYSGKTSVQICFSSPFSSKAVDTVL